jgi:hypothetical protein
MPEPQEDLLAHALGVARAPEHSKRRRVHAGRLGAVEGGEGLGTGVRRWLLPVGGREEVPEGGTGSSQREQGYG